jgi:hypothetical protein
MAGQGQFKRATAARWISVNPILASGELGLETDTNKMKFGNGTDHWNDLSYANIGNTGAQGPTGPQGQGFNNVGTATLSFGNTAGSEQTSVDVTGQTNILSSSNIIVNIITAATSTNFLEDIIYSDMAVFAGNIIEGVGFTIYGVSRGGRLQGDYTVQWAWI